MFIFLFSCLWNGVLKISKLIVGLGVEVYNVSVYSFKNQARAFPKSIAQSSWCFKLNVILYFYSNLKHDKVLAGKVSDDMANRCLAKPSLFYTEEESYAKSIPEQFEWLVSVVDKFSQLLSNWKWSNSFHKFQCFQHCRCSRRSVQGQRNDRRLDQIPTTIQTTPRCMETMWH